MYQINKEKPENLKIFPIQIRRKVVNPKFLKLVLIYVSFCHGEKFLHCVEELHLSREKCHRRKRTLTDSIYLFTKIVNIEKSSRRKLLTNVITMHWMVTWQNIGEEKRTCCFEDFTHNELNNWKNSKLKFNFSGFGCRRICMVFCFDSLKHQHLFPCSNGKRSLRSQNYHLHENPNLVFSILISTYPVEHFEWEKVIWDNYLSS